VAPRRATMGMENASVLPEPVLPRPRTSRPARVSGRVSCWMGKASTLPSAARTRAIGAGTPSCANVVGAEEDCEAVMEKPFNVPGHGATHRGCRRTMQWQGRAHRLVGSFAAREVLRKPEPAVHTV